MVVGSDTYMIHLHQGREGEDGVDVHQSRQVAAYHDLSEQQPVAGACWRGKAVGSQAVYQYGVLTYRLTAYFSTPSLEHPLLLVSSKDRRESNHEVNLVASRPATASNIQSK
ncbi:hypothetical protein IF1G_00103 [Cordyceps javanica]|uniref:Uncharacterized protein n=1 Tax=Cordyceps javanica TaxID=43265 RepID=A0A545VEM3_9HYPO|nr:hypothetical protein IF1G_00103 [Cordyceps javanica]